MIKTYTGNEGNRDGAQELILGFNIRNTIKQQAITVTAVAAAVPTTQLTRRAFLMIQNIGTAEIYIGDSTVSTANGFPLYPRAVIRIEVEDDVDIYAIAASSVACRIIEGA